MGHECLKWCKEFVYVSVRVNHIHVNRTYVSEHIKIEVWM